MIRWDDVADEDVRPIHNHTIPQGKTLCGFSTLAVSPPSHVEIPIFKYPPGNKDSHNTDPRIVLLEYSL